MEQMRAVRRGAVVQQFPGQAEDGWVFGAEGQQAGFVFGVLEAVEQPPGFFVAEYGFE